MGRRAVGHLRQERPARRHDPVEQRPVLGWIRRIEARGQDGQRGTAGIERALVGGGVNPERSAAHDGAPRGRQVPGQPPRELDRLRVGGAGSHNRDGSVEGRQRPAGVEGGDGRTRGLERARPVGVERAEYPHGAFSPVTAGR